MKTESAVRIINDDNVSIEMSADDLVALSEAKAFCERNDYPKVNKMDSALEKVTLGL